jgi:hypothetical protein
MHSQILQDEFVHKLIGDSGFFVDIGAGWVEPQLNSNSLLLEEKGWSGICIDGDKQSAENRKNKAIRANVLNVMIPDTTIISILKDYNAPSIIDYVSIDIEPSSLTGLINFPLDEYEFKVLTFEHDSYRTGLNDKNTSHEILKSKGYICLCEDLCVPREFSLTGYFEDWWVNPKYFNPEYINVNTFHGVTGQFVVENIKSPI